MMVNDEGQRYKKPAYAAAPIATSTHARVWREQLRLGVCLQSWCCEHQDSWPALHHQSRRRQTERPLSEFCPEVELLAHRAPNVAKVTAIANPVPNATRISVREDMPTTPIALAPTTRLKMKPEALAVRRSDRIHQWSASLDGAGMDTRKDDLACADRDAGGQDHHRAAPEQDRQERQAALTIRAIPYQDPEMEAERLKRCMRRAGQDHSEGLSSTLSNSEPVRPSPRRG